jgi:hypothetical protein
MIRNCRFLGFLLILCLANQVIIAQTVSRTGYFVENSTHRHLMNPALVPSRGYLALPAVGELYLGTESNLKFSNYIYPANSESNGKLRTFLHPTVDGTSFLEAIQDDQFLKTDIRTSILSFGYYAGRSSFITFDVATRVNMTLNLPYDLFAFLKKGMNNGSETTYNLDNFSVDASMFAEVSLGYSVNLTDALRIGLKGKFLAGGAYVKAAIKQMEITMSEDEWSVTTQGQLDVYGKGLEFEKDADQYINGFTFANPGLGGTGMAFDLGIDWSPFQGMDITMAIVDVGGIKWKKENTRTAASSGAVNFSGVQNFNPDSLGILAVQDQLSGLQDNLMGMAKFRQQTAVEDFFQQLNPTINIGAEYSLKRISIGGLMTTRLLEGAQYTEYMASINLKPFKWFNLSGSYSFLHGMQETFGFALGFMPGIINIFLSCDYVPTNFSPQFIPLNTATTNVQLGVSIPLGWGHLPDKH